MADGATSVHVSSTVVRAGAIAAIVLFLAAGVWLSAASVGFVSTDTYEVLEGTGAIDACLHDGVSTPCSGVGSFPLLQYVPALAVKRLGGHLDDALRVLVALNGLAFAGLFVLIWRLGRRLRARYAATALGGAVLASPLLWYSHAGFGEALAAFLIAAYTYALLARGSPLVLFATLVLAGITKETALVFLLAIALLVVWAARLRQEATLRRGQLVALLAGAIVTVAVNCGFNLFRYGALTNSDYLQDAYRMPLRLVPEYFAGLLISPTGGLVFMWPLMLALLALAGWIAWRRSGRSAFREPAFGVIALGAALLLSLAAWFGPFGGGAWGSRLIAPWLPALGLLSTAFYAEGLEELLGRLVRSRAALAAAVAAVALAGLPQLSVTVDSSHRAHPYPGTTGSRDEIAIGAYFPDRQCPSYPAKLGNDYYRHCLHHWTWGSGLAVIQAYGALGRRNAPSFALLYVLAIASAAFLLTARPRAPDPAADTL